ncbi:MAG: resolvase [Candidatus Saganbacteria bacterium]|nr:resolvase [Candidatus Saganbacteria bacterium]
MMIISIDPGSKKCGIAVLDSKKVQYKEIVKTDDLGLRVRQLMNTYSLSEIIIGSGTGSEFVVKEVKALKLSLPIRVVAEKFSTLMARKLYWIDNPPRGLKRFIPKSLLFPPRPIDDYAAVVLGRQYLG